MQQGCICFNGYFLLNIKLWFLEWSIFYPQNKGFLLTCYAAGIPFLKVTMPDDLYYSIVLFGAFSLSQKRFPNLRLGKVCHRRKVTIHFKIPTKKEFFHPKI
jgi:hypothetical protein